VNGCRTLLQFAELWNAAQRITNDRITVNKPRTNAKSTWLAFISLFLAQSGLRTGERRA
jgi:hypothetical protein